MISLNSDLLIEAWSEKKRNEIWWGLCQATRTTRASGFYRLQSDSGTGIPGFNGTGKIALGRGVERIAVG